MGQCSSKPPEQQILREESPEEVNNRIIEEAPIFPQLLTAAPFQYILRKVSDICRQDFLRWGLRNPQNPLRFLYDPEQTITGKVEHIIRTTGLIPTIYYADEDSFILTGRNITATSHTQQFPLSEFRRALDFFKSHVIIKFIYNTKQLRTNGTPMSHSFLFKRTHPDDPNAVEVIDSNGMTYEELVNDPRGGMTKRSYDFITRFITEGRIIIEKTAVCQFQTYRGTCALWATLFALYPTKSRQELKEMIDRAIVHAKLPILRTGKPAAESYDMFIMELFYQFIQNPILASSVPADYTEGFGKPKCKKCGLPKR
jgi:hypothetical protein